MRRAPALVLFLLALPLSAESSEEVERLREACTPSMDRAASEAVSKAEGNRLFVQPLVWNLMTIDARRGLAGWFSICQLRGEFIHIKHGNTGRRLAMFSPETGYNGAE